MPIVSSLTKLSAAVRSIRHAPMLAAAAAVLLAGCHGVSLARTQAQPPASYHIEYYQISER